MKEEGGSAVMTEILLLGRLPTSLRAVQGATKNLDTRWPGSEGLDGGGLGPEENKWITDWGGEQGETDLDLMETNWNWSSEKEGRTDVDS